MAKGGGLAMCLCQGRCNRDQGLSRREVLWHGDFVLEVCAFESFWLGLEKVGWHTVRGNVGVGRASKQVMLGKGAGVEG